jgi:hypothetical protein
MTPAIGAAFGRWTLLGDPERQHASSGYVRARCSCGTVRDVPLSNMKRGHSLSCGCLQTEVASSKRQLAQIGARFNRLVVLGEAPDRALPSGIPVRFVRVLCDCGVTKQVPLRTLIAGRSTSCGCVQRENRYAHGTHHQSGTRTYRAWKAMHDRCRGSLPRNVRDYQDRGIYVCQRWTGPGGFENFLADVGERPAGRRMMLHRIDNDGIYEPGNCRWTTIHDSNRNKRNNVWIDLPDGRRLCVVDACSAAGINKQVIWDRTYRHCVSHQAAFDYYLGRRAVGPLHQQQEH